MKPKVNFIILRHDVDRNPLNALNMARMENQLGLVSTYYFRCNKEVFNRKIIAEMQELNHEIGYHYEVLSKSRGNYESAIKLFEKELALFREICEVDTISMHGSPLSKYNNINLWDRYDFKDYGIKGDAVLSISDVPYFTDTGRNWNFNNNYRDLSQNDAKLDIKNTEELKSYLIKNKGKYYLSIHPERWSSSSYQWLLSYVFDLLANQAKKILHNTL
jgi:hypothetical protein